MFFRILTKKNPVRLEDRGAVIFDYNMNFRWFWKDIGNLEEGELLSPSEKFDTQFYDSGIGRSVGLSAAEGSRILTSLALSKS